MTINFEEFWERLIKELRTSKTIKNWTAKKGYIGDDFNAVWERGNYIKCEPQSAGIQTIPKWDFEFLYKNWEAYLNDRMKRHMLRDESRFTKYTISIMHQFEHLRKE